MGDQHAWLSVEINKAFEWQQGEPRELALGLIVYWWLIIKPFGATGAAHQWHNSALD